MQRARLFFALCVLLLALPRAHGGEVLLFAVADTWTHGLTNTTNHGASTDLGICPNANYWIYLKFDLSSLEGRVLDAELRLTRFSGSRPEEISLYAVADDSWTEATLTGPTRPEPRMPASQDALVQGLSVPGYDVWAGPSLTALVREEAAGDRTLTVMIREDPNAMTDVRRYFSREGAQMPGQRPRLEILIDQEVVADDWRVDDVGFGTKPSFDFGPGDRVDVMGMTEEHDGGVVWHASAASPAGPWSPRIVAEGYYYGPGDIRVSGEGVAHLAWHNHELEDADHVAVDGATLRRSTLHTPGNHDGWDNSLAFDESGGLHMASVNPIAFGAPVGLQYRKFDGAAWSYDEVVDSGAFMYGLNTSIAIDRAGEPHIAFCYATDWTSPGELRYAVRRGRAWTVSTVVADGAVGRFPSLALDHWDRPHIAWFDIDPVESSLATVSYGVLNGGTWEIETVDTLNNVQLGFSAARKSVSLVLDGESRPHLAYGDQRSLRFAVKPFAAWEVTQVLDQPLSTYKGLVVLRLDSRGRPAIVFWQTDLAAAGLVRLASFTGDCVIGNCGAQQFHRGDANASGSVDITDGIFVLGYLFLGGTLPPCLEAADANNDGRVDLSDGVSVLNYLFTGGPAPLDPGPPPAPCGADPDPVGSVKDLGCVSYTPCPARV